MLVTVLALGALAIPSKDLHLALPTDSTAAEGTPERASADLIAEHFGAGQESRMVVVIDGRDLEPGTVQFWAGQGSVDATLRLLREDDGTERIGRVATARHARSQGLGAQLMEAAIAESRSSSIAINAQAHLEHWYARFGFDVAGDGFDEDGIPHVPMRREPA